MEYFIKSFQKLKKQSRLEMNPDFAHSDTRA